MRKHYTVLYTAIHTIYICYTCMYNNNLHTVLHSCVKCVITQIYTSGITGDRARVCTSVNQS